MKEHLKMLCDTQPHGREIARNMVVMGSLQERISEAEGQDMLNQNDWDLNPHLQVKFVASQVVADAQKEGFEETSVEEVYLAWLTHKIFHE